MPCLVVPAYTFIQLASHALPDIISLSLRFLLVLAARFMLLLLYYLFKSLRTKTLCWPWNPMLILKFTLLLPLCTFDTCSSTTFRSWPSHQHLFHWSLVLINSVLDCLINSVLDCLFYLKFMNAFVHKLQGPCMIFESSNYVTLSASFHFVDHDHDCLFHRE